jgi:hypothetical protein
VVPSLRNFALRFNDVTLVALCFETDRAPYVVLNADFGTVRGDPAKREVPWREGNSTRSAKRQELLRLLAPTVRLPEVEILSAGANVRFGQPWAPVPQDTGYGEGELPSNNWHCDPRPV